MAVKVLLLQPPVQDFYDTPIRLQPIGLCLLKAAIRKHLPDVEVLVKDYHQGRGKRSIPLPKELRYLRDYYAYPDKSPFSTFYHYYHFGDPFEEIAEDVAAEQPDLVGISSLFSAYAREGIRCAEAIKSRLDAPLIVGGSHVSADPEGMLRQDCVDFVIRGEGERPLVEFLRAWRQGGDFEQVPNLGFKRNGGIVLNPTEPNYSIDELPVPDFSDLPPQRYRFEQRPLCMIVTSRGCPFACAFCSGHLTFGRRYRRRSNEAILRELHQRYQEGYRVFDFEDDNLTVDMEAMKALCRCIVEEFPPSELQLLAMNGLSYEQLDPELLALMKSAGFSHLNLSLVSADPRIRRESRRPHSLERYLTVVKEGAKLGFQIVSYQILGLPGESLDSAIDTLALNARLPVLLGASMFYVSPQMSILTQFPELCVPDAFVSARLSAMAIETAQISRDEIFTLFVTTRILNFLKGLELPAETCSYAEALESAAEAGGRTALGAEILKRLFTSDCLFAAVGQDFKPMLRFQTDLFFRIWEGLESIGTQQEKRITGLRDV